MSNGPKIMRIAAGVRATSILYIYIGNGNLFRESRGKSANNIVRAAEHASRDENKFIIGAPDICAR